MEFNNISVVKTANIYFDGRVTSRTVLFADGTKKTLGIMLPGKYTFGTQNAEEMEILQGSLKVKLPDENDWQILNAPCSFFVPANSSFDIEILSVCDYCCSYL